MEIKPNKRRYNIAEIERKISKDYPVTSMFLSWKTACISILFGVTGLLANMFKQQGYLIQFSTTEVNVASLASVILLAYGLIVLSNYDWTWGKLK